MSEIKGWVDIFISTPLFRHANTIIGNKEKTNKTTYKDIRFVMSQ